jgi:hypothetical protein
MNLQYVGKKSGETQVAQGQILIFLDHNTMGKYSIDGDAVSFTSKQDDSIVTQQIPLNVVDQIYNSDGVLLFDSASGSNSQGPLETSVAKLSSDVFPGVAGLDFAILLNPKYSNIISSQNNQTKFSSNSYDETLTIRPFGVTGLYVLKD